MKEIPRKLADEAAENLEAFYLKLVSWDQVIQWADEWILYLDCHPEALLEVSLSSQVQEQGKTALAELARQSDQETVFPHLKKLWREALESERVNGLTVVQQAWMMQAYAGYDTKDYGYISLLKDLLDQLENDDCVEREETSEKLERKLREFLKSPVTTPDAPAPARPVHPSGRRGGD